MDIYIPNGKIAKTEKNKSGMVTSSKGLYHIPMESQNRTREIYSLLR